MIGKKVIVAGATGSVGRLIVKTCIEDPRIERVTACVRKIQPDEFWNINNENNEKTSINEKLKQIPVDYTTLDEDNNSKSLLQEAFQGHNAFLTALGVYSNKASEEEMYTIEGKYNITLAKIAHSVNTVKRGTYLSGDGVKQPKLERTAWSKFGRVKGQAEEELASIFNGQDDEIHISVRPGAILDRPGQPVYGFIDGTLLKLWPFYLIKNTSMGITAHDIAKGMIQGTIFDDKETLLQQQQGNNNVIWDNETIKKAARRYDEQLLKKETS